MWQKLIPGDDLYEQRRGDKSQCGNGQSQQEHQLQRHLIHPASTIHRALNFAGNNGEQCHRKERRHNLQSVEPFVGTVIPADNLTAVIEHHPQDNDIGHNKDGLQEMDEHERKALANHLFLQAKVYPPWARQIEIAEGKEGKDDQGDDVGENGNGR